MKTGNFSKSLISKRLDEHQNKHQNALVMGVVYLKNVRRHMFLPHK